MDKKGYKMKQLEEIRGMMFNGHWSIAQKYFKSINPTPTEFMCFLQDKSDEELRDWALLGFYTREFTPRCEDVE